jgi:hypothetical protein
MPWAKTRRRRFLPIPPDVRLLAARPSRIRPFAAVIRHSILTGELPELFVFRGSISAEGGDGKRRSRAEQKLATTVIMNSPKLGFAGWTAFKANPVPTDWFWQVLVPAGRVDGRRAGECDARALKNISLRSRSITGRGPEEAQAVAPSYPRILEMRELNHKVSKNATKSFFCCSLKPMPNR